MPTQPSRESTKQIDEELRRELKTLANDRTLEFSEWEQKFIKSTCYEYKGPLSAKQRGVMEKIIGNYRNPQDAEGSTGEDCPF